MTGDISGAGTADPSWAPEFTTDFKWGSCCSVFYAVFCRSLFVFLSFWPFCCFLPFTDSDYPFVIFKLSLYYCNNLGYGHVRKHWKPRLKFPPDHVFWFPIDFYQIKRLSYFFIVFGQFPHLVSCSFIQVSRCSINFIHRFPWQCSSDTLLPLLEVVIIVYCNM